MQTDRAVSDDDIRRAIHAAEIKSRPRDAETIPRANGAAYSGVRYSTLNPPENEPSRLPSMPPDAVAFLAELRRRDLQRRAA